MLKLPLAVCCGHTQPDGDPNGFTFDRDYAGGGPVLPVSSAGQPAVLLIYHGEWQGGTCANTGTCFYASLGMAISYDGGATFSKIVQPYISRATSINSGRNLDIGGGTLLLADQNGQYISDPAASNPANVYLYVFYPDRDSSASTTAPCAQDSCIALARALLSDVVTAAIAGNSSAFPTLFQKYYQGGFTEPATSGDPNAAIPSGHYTPIISDAGNFPTVIYDTSVNQ